MPKSLSALKKSTYTTNEAQEELEDHNDPVCTGTMITYLYLIVDVPPDVAIDDGSIGSFGSQLFFSTTQSQNQDYYLQGDTHQSLALYEEDPIQNTTVAFAQSSQSVKEYGMPSVLT